MNNLLTAIMTKCSGSALSDDVGGRIYLDQAEQGAQLPYIVFFIVSDVPSHTFTEDFEDVLIQFSMFSDSDGAVEITTMYGHLKALFDEAIFAVTSSTLVWFRRQNLVTNVEDFTTATAAETVKHWAVDYEVKLSTN
jgi:hypothetical protein